MPSASSAGVYGDGAARIAGRDDGAGAGRQDRRGAGAGPGGTDDVDPLAGPDRARVTGRRQTGADALGRARHDAIRDRGRSARGRARARPARWRACCPRAIAGPDDSDGPRCRVASATATYVSPTGFAAVPPSGPAIPVTDTRRGRRRSGRVRRWPSPARSGPTPRRAPPGRRPGRRPVACLSCVRVRHEAADVVGARPGRLGEQRGRQPAGARLDRRDRAVAGARHRSPQREPRGRTSGSSATALPPLGLDRRVRWREQPGLRARPARPSAPSDVPFSVK